MLALRVVEHLDVVEDVLSRDISGPVGFSPDALTLEEVEEALSNSIVVTVAPAAHAVFEVVLLQERDPVDAGELCALIRVDQNFTCWLSAPHCREQGMQHQIGGLTALH